MGRKDSKDKKLRIGFLRLSSKEKADYYNHVQDVHRQHKYRKEKVRDLGQKIASSGTPDESLIQETDPKERKIQLKAFNLLKKTIQDKKKEIERKNKDLIGKKQLQRRGFHEDAKIPSSHIRKIDK